MFAWRLDGPIEFWNSGAERLYGFSSNEAVGRSSHALLQTKFPTDFAELRSHLQNGRYWSGELRHVCKDGREVIVDSRMQLLGDNTVLEVNRDVRDGTLERIHHALYVAVREQAGREASPTTAIIDSQSAKGAQKGGLRSIRRALMRARRSRVASGTA